MQSNNMVLTFSSNLDRMTEYNSSFDQGILKVCYIGNNRNGSSIKKSVFEKCMKSIYNCPIVCNYIRDSDTIGEHDMGVVRDPEDTVRLINLTTPVGVIPESAKWWWESVEEDDGTVHEYLFVEVLIWKRQEAYRKIKNDGITKESMEISVKDGHMEDGVFVIDDFEFTAFCLLGTAEPCYESASLTMFSMRGLKDRLDEMMGEFKNSLLSDQPKEMARCEDSAIDEEGGETPLDEKNNLVNKYGFSIDQLDFSLDSVSIEELEEKLKERKFALEAQFKEELTRALYAVTYEDPYWGTMSQYCFVDYDPAAMEIYALDAGDDFKLYGFAYSMNGDNVVIDFESKKRMKINIIPFDDGEQNFAFAKVYSSITDLAKKKDTAWESKLSTAETELDELREFKNKVEEEEAEEAAEEVLAKFEDLNGVEAFETLRTDATKYTLADLEEKCYAIRGRTQTVAKFGLNGRRMPKLPVEGNNNPANEPYGGLFVEYGFDD